MDKMATLIFIMVFYSILTFCIFPYIGFRYYGIDGITYGIILGAVISIVLWKQYGIKLVK